MTVFGLMYCFNFLLRVCIVCACIVPRPCTVYFILLWHDIHLKPVFAERAVHLNTNQATVCNFQEVGHNKTLSQKFASNWLYNSKKSSSSSSSSSSSPFIEKLACATHLQW